MALSISVPNRQQRMRKRTVMSLLQSAHNPKRMERVQSLLEISQLLLRIQALVWGKRPMQWLQAVLVLARNHLLIEIITSLLVRKQSR